MVANHCRVLGEHASTQKPEALAVEFEVAEMAGGKMFGGSGLPETTWVAALFVPSMAYRLQEDRPPPVTGTKIMTEMQFLVRKELRVRENTKSQVLLRADARRQPWLADPFPVKGFYLFIKEIFKPL